jgi:lipopolysaccharide transport protein LptA
VKPQRLKQLQLALVAIAVLVGVAVVRTLRGPAPVPSALPTLPPDANQKGVMQAREGEVTELKGGDERVKVRFRRMVGREGEELQLEGVELAFQYTAQGEPGVGRIRADECRYMAALQKAQFRGSVVVTTADGFEMKAPALQYRGDKGVVRSEDLVEFRRKSVSGRTRGLIYDAAAGTAEFQSEAYLRIEDDAAPPMEVHGGRAELDKAKGELRFFDGVKATRGEDVLTSKRLVLAYAADRRAINSLQAFDDVHLLLSGATGAGLGMSGGAKGSGRREIKSPGLGIWFRPDRTPEEASAFFDAELILHPGPGEAREQRSIRANLLLFRFDRQGRLAEVLGQKNATLLATPLAPAKGDPQTLTCKNVVARFKPGSGELESAEARGDVEFAQGRRRASAQRGTLDGPSGVLTLQQGQPTLVEAEKSRLNADRIEHNSRTGDLRAVGSARQALLSEKASGFLVQAGQPTLLSADSIDHVSKTRTTVYDGSALLRSGKDEVRARRLTIREDAQGRRQLEADEQVFSRMQPAARAGGTLPAPVEARAAKMVYDEAAGQVHYRGDVALKQGEVATHSPSATLQLGADGRSLKQLVAGEPVELSEGLRKARGERATYTPENETIVVEGEAVTLVGPGQDVKGRSLTFHVGDDRILVDGREQGRTETVFRKEPSKP